MNVRMITLLIFSVLGTGVFVALGTWQLQRLEWKTNLLIAIDDRMQASPVSVPDNPDPIADKYLRVHISGTIGEDGLRVLTSTDGTPGYKIISVATLGDGRRILVDRGFIPTTRTDTIWVGGPVNASGSLIWPLETDNYTPAPDREDNLWFARDVELMAVELNTAPILLSITESDNNEGIEPQPVQINIHNRHLEYVLTWYGFAIIWVLMTGLLIWRIKRQIQ